MRRNVNIFPLLRLYDANTWIVAMEEAPSGMIARSHYEVLSRFMDDDGHKYLEFNWSFNIKKSWD